MWRAKSVFLFHFYTEKKKYKIQNIITNTNFKKGGDGGGRDKEKRDVNWSMCLSTTP